jgi:YD repeat-containing protein
VASYDAVGQLTQLMHRNAAAQSVVAYAYQYDLAGQVTQEQHHGETITYTHDLVGQLLSATRTVQPSESYTYDAVGNSTATGTVIGAGNRILSDAQFTYTYDGEGNLTRKVAITQGTYCPTFLSEPEA